jgi:hypothetical protein
LELDFLERPLPTYAYYDALDEGMPKKLLVVIVYIGVVKPYIGCKGVKTRMHGKEKFGIGLV